MNNELMTVTSGTPGEVIDYKAKALDYLSSMGSKLPVKHQTQFLEMAQAFNLNPFKREIYAVGYGENWNIITGYEVYLKRAERVGKLDGWKAEVTGSGDDMSATVTIYRKDWKYPFVHTVLYNEVCNKNKDGRPNTVWAKMPSFMTRKVAIAQAFRLCFPDEFGGMPYTSDEIQAEEQTNEPINITPTVAPEPPKPSYTQEQGEEIGRIIKSNPEIFTEERKKEFRRMLIEQGGEYTLNAALNLLNEYNL